MSYQAEAVVEKVRRGGSTSRAKAASKRTAKPSKKITKTREREIERLVLEHRDNGRKLARSLLRRWRARMNIEEVDSIVDLTLCEAAQRYSPTHGASFMTFFFYHLRGYLVRAVATAVNSSNVVVGLGTRPGQEIGEWSPNGDESFKSFLPECASFGLHEVDGPENLLLRKENIEACRSACSQLDELEQEVLIRSYEREEALVDIARSLGYSRCHISRVKKRAIERLEAILGIPAVEESARTNGALVMRGAGTRRTVKRRNRRRAQLSTEQVRVKRSA